MTGGRPGIAWHFLRAQWAFTHLRGDALARYQNRRALQTVAFAACRSPFYAAHWNGHDRADWQRLPVTDKVQMMAHFDDFNTRGISCDQAMAVALRAEQDRDFAPTLRGGITVGLSSGTSGHRGLFLVGPSETAAWAGTVLARTLHALPPRGYRVAFFLRSNSNLYERVGASGRVCFRYFDLMTPLGEAVAALNDYRPNLLVGPPSLLGMLAGAAERGALRVRPGRLVSVAEVLEPQDRARLQKVFGVAVVHEVYQCTEGLLGATCSAGRLHVQEDLVALQFEPVGATETNRVTPVVTDLWRRVQPIVRYRLDDVLHLGRETAACPCGSAFRVLDAVEGRHDDVCYFVAAGSGGHGKTDDLRPFFPDTVRRMALLAHPNIADYAVVQERPGHLRVFLVVSSGGASFDAVAGAVRASVAATMARYGCRAAHVEIERGLPPVPVPNAKRRRVRNAAPAAQ